jgi:ABC-type dipeptide/oligopeptide/nickel transport system ATPase component
MKDGQIVEQGTAHAVIRNPQDVYTRKLVASAPRLSDRGSLLRGVLAARSQQKVEQETSR